MKLVIAEKPSVAMSLAAVLGANEKKDGYLEGGGYLVSWCIGHLLELAQPEAYGEQYARWRYADLPILPETWKYEVPKDKKKQLALLCRLMKDKGVDSVVCATDAGREGELIFRLVYEHAGCKKPMERLWISSMEDAAIRDGFEHLRPGSDYDTLYDVAVCRAGADWLVGINATRLFSVLYGVTLNVGRVMSPTLALLVQREADIGAFVSRPFYVPEITCGGFTASGEKLAEKAEADTIRIECDKQATSVQSVEKQVKTVQTPHLYDLTTLQRECNRIYGYTAQQTLDYVQSLYEKKLATYPRTDSQYLSEDMQATAASLVLWLRGNMPFGKGCAGEPDIDRVTDGSKVTDHHAIIPTVEIARTDLSELLSGERDVLTLIAARLLSATAQTHRFEAVTAVLDCQGYLFTAKGKTVLQAGWKEVERLYRMGLKESGPEDGGDTDASLPMLQEGQIFETVSAGVREGKTSPPKHYTEDSLLAAMETAGAEDMPEDAERKGLGTPATRAATLEKLVSTGFVQRKKKQLIPTEKGTNLIAVLPDNIKSPILLVDIEAAIRSGKGPGYERWAKVFNLKQLSQAVIYLKEHGDMSYEDLQEKSDAVTASFNALSVQIKELESQMAANGELQKQIVNYAKTRAVYVEYRKAGYSKKFRAAHEAEILLHQTAKKYFDEVGITKLPSVKALREEYAGLLEQKRKAYSAYKQARADMKELYNVRANVEHLLDIPTGREPQRESQKSRQ